MSYGLFCQVLSQSLQQACVTDSANEKYIGTGAGGWSIPRKTQLDIVLLPVNVCHALRRWRRAAERPRDSNEYRLDDNDHNRDDHFAGTKTLRAIDVFSLHIRT